MELSYALNSLGGKQGTGLVEHYQFYTARHINRAAEGYCFLRRAGRVDASKHLVRPIVESVIRVHAIRKMPELMYRIAYTDFQDMKNWVRPFNDDPKVDALSEIDRQWSDFDAKYSEKYPDHKRTKERLPLRKAAELAEIDGYYDSHYRLFCQFTHGSFRATVGDFDDFEPEDNRTVALCLFVTIDCLVDLGASNCDVTSIRKRLSELK